MIETLGLFALGIISGIFSGIMPGIGGLVMMVLSLPILMQCDPANILIFYITLVSVDQFFSGVTAITLALPGSAMSVPTMVEGHHMFRNNQGATAIMFSAVGSWFASVFAVLLIICLLPLLNSVYGVWNTIIQSTLFTIATIGICTVSRNNVFFNIVLFFSGLFLAKVGWNEEQGEMLYTFGLTALETGIPVLSVLTGLFVVPMLVTAYIDNKQAINFQRLNLGGYIQTVKDMGKHTSTLVRSSFLGSIGGFVPGMSYAFSSMFAYSVERWIRVTNKQYKPGDVKCLIASESANNAGAFTQMVPLLFLGIPITASEALIYNILESRGLPVDIEWFTSTFTQVVFFFLISATIGMFLAGKYVNFLRVLNKLKVEYVYLGIVLVCIALNYVVGAQQYNAVNQLMVTLLLIPIGLLFIKRDTTPLIFGFVLSEPLVDGFYRLYQLYI